MVRSEELRAVEEAMGTSSEDTLEAAIQGLLQAMTKVVLIFTIILAASLEDRIIANSEGDALIAFKEALTYDVGYFLSWSNLSTNSTPCTWEYVQCDNDGHVQNLSITNIGLSGSLVPALGSLNYLQILDLHDNYFAGTIPAELGNLTNLITLDLSYNKLEGQLPEALFNNSKLAKLNTLNLGFNSLQGTIPTSTTSQLSYVDLSWNQFTGEISSTFNNTETLILSKNIFIGSLPTFIWASPRRILYLSGNLFNGFDRPFPNSSTDSLQQLDISDNKFTGQFPSELLTNFPKLQSIDANDNDFGGALDLTNHTSMLNSLSLLGNNISQVTSLKGNTGAISIILIGNPFCENVYSSQTFMQENITCVISYDDNEWAGGEAGGNRWRTPLLISIGVLLGVSVFGVFTWMLCKKSSMLREIQQELARQQVQPTLYSYNEIKLATKNFHPNNKLGEGAFGLVYKGVLPNGVEMAVKKLRDFHQGVSDFLNEVILITGIRHRNLVQLKGCCMKDNLRVLIYEYVENGDLAKALWDENDGPILSWSNRFNICVGIARGLTYLHEDSQPRIIHRDIKAPNILLDKDMKAKIADFGLARLCPDEQSHLSTLHIAGTMGYMSPEYATQGQLSEKVDVYSFGVLVLEIVTGRKNIDSSLPPDEIYILAWAQNRYEEGKLLDLLDKKLNTGQAPPPQDVQRVLTIALMCVQANAARRPSMSTVLAMLLGEQELEFVTQESSVDNIYRTLLDLQLPDHQQYNSRHLEPIREAEEPLLRIIEAPRMSQCSNTLELSNMQPR